MSRGWFVEFTVNRWRLVLYFPDTEFHTFFSGQVPISSDIHVVRTFPFRSEVSIIPVTVYGKRYETMVNKWWDRSDWWMLDWPRHRYNEIKSGVIIELFCAVTDGKWDRVTGVYICLLLMWLITRRTTSTSYGVMSLLTGLSSQSPPIICKARGGGVANDWRWLSLVPHSLVYTDVSPYGRPFTLN